MVIQNFRVRKFSKKKHLIMKKIESKKIFYPEIFWSKDILGKKEIWVKQTGLLKDIGRQRF